MTLPKRNKSHIIETSARALLISQLPRPWIPRDITERDYGVDLYVEIVGFDMKITGKMASLQVKGAEEIHFTKGKARIPGIRRSTLNYLLGLPMPAYVAGVCLASNRSFWANLRALDRAGVFAGTPSSRSVSVPLDEKNRFCAASIRGFLFDYERESKWATIEGAIEKGLMLYNTLGPLVLMIGRVKKTSPCTTTVQYLVNQHFEHYVLLCRYLLGKRPQSLNAWYEANTAFANDHSLAPSHTLFGGVLEEMFGSIVRDYRDGLIEAYSLVTKHQANYFRRKFPHLTAHLAARPHTFLFDDWFARYYFDEFEAETQDPRHLYFEDFNEFDGILDGLTPT